MPEFEAIFFDFDGVLADTEPVHHACWAEVLAPLGVKLDWGFYSRHCVGIDDREMLRTIAGLSVPPRAWEDLWSLYPVKRDLFRARLTATPPFEFRLDAFLERLHADYRMAVVSSSSGGEIEPLLVAAGIRRHFDTLVGGGDVKHHKPAPDPYRLAAERLGVSSALVVEDSQAGIASGQAAGFEVLAVTGPSRMPEAVMRRLAEAL